MKKKAENENKDEKLQQKRDSQTEANKSSTIRGLFWPININKRLNSLLKGASSSRQTDIDNFTETIKSHHNVYYSLNLTPY